jgi:hypothetical protein
MLGCISQITKRKAPGSGFAVEVVYLKGGRKEGRRPTQRSGWAWKIDVGGLGRLMWVGLCVFCLWGGALKIS